jgi:hypothetical protein
MATTVQVENTTRQSLEELKRRWGFETYNEVITELVKKVVELPDSMFGSNPKLRPFKETERVEFHR